MGNEQLLDETLDCFGRVLNLPSLFPHGVTSRLASVAFDYAV